MSMLKFGTALLSASFLLTMAFAAQGQAWRSYHNERFGTIADVPSDWNSGEPPANNDGLVFSAPDGKASLTVSGILQIEKKPLKEVLAEQAAPMANETVTYKAVGPRWVVVSGTAGDKVFYRKSLLSCRGQIWNSIYLVYPASEQARYKAIVQHVQASLKMGKGYQIANCR